MRGIALIIVAACGEPASDPPVDAPRIPRDARDAGPPVDARDLPANRVFVSKLTSLGFGTLANADAFCNANAAERGYSGTFVAWLSTSTTPARDRLAGSRGWMRDDGMPVVNTVADLVAGKILYPIFVRGDGARTQVATGTNPEGTVHEDSCSDFTSTATGALARAGQTYAGTSQWTSYGWESCSAEASIYCFEVGKVVDVAPPPVIASRLAFVTAGRFTATTGGIGSADAMCRMDAMLAGKPGSFKALLATSNGSATSRFSDGPPWVRADAVQVTATAMALLSEGELQAPINVTAGGAYVADTAWIGAQEFDGPAMASCNDWALSTGQGERMQVETGKASTAFVFDGSCVLGERLVCLQE